MSSGLAGERGSGLLGVTLGIGVVMTLLLTSAHLLLHLYVTTVVTAAGYDAAVEAAAHSTDAAGDTAESDGSGVRTAHAEASARQALGALAERAVFDWSSSTADEVVLRLETSSPGLVPARFAGTMGLTAVEREFRVRVERFR